MKTNAVFCAVSVAILLSAKAGNLDTTGVTRLRTNDATLTGIGMTVGQPEAQNTDGVNNWEVYPPNAGQPTGLFSWINTNGTATTFPNSLGTDSPHGDQVAVAYYGSSGGVAPGVLHVNNYEADYYFASVITEHLPVLDAVENQSFIFPGDVTTQTTVDASYDDYVDLYGTLFCSGVGDGGSPSSPGTAYNSLGVGAYGVGASTSIGPTADNGRSKPDIVAPGGVDSFAIPYVSGAAAVLLQSAGRGDGGSNTNAATDERTVRSLLINGAIKPGDWTHTPNAPLDTRYGSGVLNLYYSIQQLAAGQKATSSSQQVSSGTHMAGTPVNVISSTLGWDYQSINSGLTGDAVNHYYFDNSGNSSPLLTFTTTLAWNRQTGQTGVNNLALYLYNTVSGSLVTNSISPVDNVQHIYIPNLPRGKYDLQVYKTGGLTQVSSSETYALAFQFYPVSPPPLSLSVTGGNTIVSWPSSPTIFNLQQTTSLTPPISWSPVSTVGLLTNTVVQVTLGSGAAKAFYRLVRQ